MSDRNKSYDERISPIIRDRYSREYQTLIDDINARFAVIQRNKDTGYNDDYLLESGDSVTVTEDSNGIIFGNITMLPNSSTNSLDFIEGGTIIASLSSSLFSTIGDTLTINSDLDDVTSKLIFGRTTGGNAEISYQGTQFGFNNNIFTQKDQNAGTTYTIRNDTNNTGAFLGYYATYGNFTDYIGMLQLSPSYTTSGLFIANTSILYSKFSDQLTIFTEDNKPVVFGTNNIERARILGGGEFLINATAAIGTEKLRVNGSSIFGGSTHYSEFEADGTLVLHGNATVFEDLNFDPTRSGGPVANRPDDVTIDNCYYVEFTSANNQSCGDSQEVPHSYKLSTNLYGHLHCFLKNGESAGTTGVTFTIYWSLRQSTGLTTGSFTLSATSAELTANPVKFDIYHGAGFTGPTEKGSQLALSLYRTAGDAGDVIVLTYGVHYEIDTIGSRTLLIK